MNSKQLRFYGLCDSRHAAFLWEPGAAPRRCTNRLSADTLYFSDPQRTNHRARFYGLRWP